MADRDKPGSIWDDLEDLDYRAQRRKGSAKSAPGAYASESWSFELAHGQAPRRSCHYSHPAVPILSGFFYGGNCYDHSHIVADVYVALDRGKLPVYRPGGPLPVAVSFEIPNMGVPASADDFRALILMLLEALGQGKTVHVGCIGGHGRTGMVLAALLAMTGDHNAIQTAREDYCVKAVESKKQVAFLVKHYKVAKAEPSK